MSDKVLDAYLQRIGKLVEMHMGLDFPGDRWNVLLRVLKKASSTLGYKDVQSFVRWLLEWSFAERNDRLQDEESVAATSLVARSYANQGMLDEALEWAERTLVVDKLNSEFHYLHRAILQEKGDLEGVKKAFGKAISLEPDFVIAHVSLSNLARVQKRQEDAKRHSRTALMILDSHNYDEILVASEGMTVRRLKEVLRPMVGT